MTKEVVLQLDGQEVTITNPDKIFFPGLGKTKLDVVNYYLAVADGALTGVRDRPMNLKRFPNGAESDPFFQKRAPTPRPSWVRTATVRFPSDRTADEVICSDRCSLAWVVNLSCIDLNPWPVRAADVEHPDELRVDLDPQPDASWDDVRKVALVARAVLEDHGLGGFPKTSGSRGIHINVPIEPRWSFEEVRRAALALAREMERRAPDIATSAWWKEERHGVFLDYNQNARDRTVASAYSVRPRPDARVSTPLTWDELPTVDASAFTIDTVPERFARLGDPAAEMHSKTGRLDGLLALADRDEANGLQDAPWPPHYPKAANEPIRAQPSRRRRP
jgi:DNA ligase D